jgi:hypothetical protein
VHETTSGELELEFGQLSREITFVGAIIQANIKTEAEKADKRLLNLIRCAKDLKQDIEK